ncbi:flavin reductase family protein [Virgibacillus alimentarius]|uniref:Flavin reductase (DIM6/NTAB) family NADH-FMN oxidoreductase RutF n=1 Tax=Virgibacillus alimentarius TaxID=698769 RepID=A0ABS4SA53_9BACI|nr:MULTISPECIES: flavin reductase family protein [Virgibacillus]MBP2258212.1 flavin reductase (DIM6/NTAB) family NADH-FMN oxidoreductase RutF [Virgibacillus alimentarius]HLR69619.1 flavin reductase family protein [Virgibacillus sp.]
MDDRVFRNTMGKFATGVTVITTKVGEDVHGMTANAFMSVSLDPKLITISIDNKANMLEKIKSSGQFAVSILGEEQQDISMHFAGQKKKEDGIDFDLVHNVPIVRDALATVVCDVHDSHVVGDHTLFIGKVFEISLRDGNPLTFYQGKYGNYAPVEYA